MLLGRIKENLKNKRNLVRAVLDVFAISVALFVALTLRFDGRVLPDFKSAYFLVYGGFFLGGYFWYRIGSNSWSYTNSLDVLKVIGINSFSLVGLLMYFALSRGQYSRTVIFMLYIFSIAFQLLGRFPFRVYRTFSFNFRKGEKKRKRAIIYGAGEAGVSLVIDSKSNPRFPYEIVAMLDDNKKKQGTYINGVKVVGGIEECGEKIRDFRPELLIIAIPGIKRKKIEKIIEVTKEANEKLVIKILPTIDEILTDDNLINQTRDIKIEDLLGRDEVLVNGDNIYSLIFNKTILITGGAGSIGSELARQIAKYNPKELILLDLNENDLYFLELELKRRYKNINLKVEICNIRELEKVEFLFEKYNPNIVFHAAAHKHVPLMENNPEEAIKNNLFGTKNIIDMADKYSVDRFVLISTDKAVNPTNVMGATKRGCELLVEYKNKNSKTKYMAVRFGNVLGSNGSVIPHFKGLLAEGKNLTITHPDITRYFMTIPEAAQLVIEAGSLGKGGEIFVLDMGEPIKIMDLAKSMIKLSGANVEIEVVGLREGEKLYEELLYNVNLAIKTSNKKIFIAKLKSESMDIEKYMERLKELVRKPDKEGIKRVLKEFIVSYRGPEHHNN